MLVNTEKQQKTSIINKMIAMMLVMTLTIANFILIAKETYAILVNENVTSQVPVEGITTKISNRVQKYIKVEDVVLLQVELNINLQKDAEQKITDGKIEIDVPKINGKLPSTTKIVNLITGYKSNYGSGILTITPNTIEGETRHKIVYLYSADVWDNGEEADITWATKVKAKVDSKEYQIEDTAKTKISQMGSVISAKVEVPTEIYKGSMYATEGTKQTEYTQNIEIETSYLNKTQSNNVKLDTLIPQIINKDGSKLVAKTYYKTSRISKNYLSSMFADEYGRYELKITSVDEQGRTTENTINQDTLVEAEGSTYILVSYPEKTVGITIQSISDIKTVSYGLKIENKKVLVTDKNNDNISNFEKIEEKVMINGIEEKSEIDLIEPTAHATIRLKDIETISSINGTQNIGIVITLNTNTMDKDQLFENPTFTIKMPEGVTVKEIEKNIKISAEGGNFTVKHVSITENNEIYIELNGKQSNHIASDINTQIILNANVEVKRMMANKVDTIKMSYTNKGTTYQAQSKGINIVSSNEKVVTNLKTENYNGQGAVLEKYSDTAIEVVGELAILNKRAVQVPVKYTIINNYGVPITVDNTIVAKQTSYKQEETQLMSKTENSIVLEPGEIKTIEGLIEVPANLYYNEKIEIEAVSSYTYSGTEYSINNKVKLATDEKEAIGNIEIIDGKFMVETLAQLGDGAVLNNNDEIYNEQIIKYTVRITNISDETVTSLNVRALQENGKMYDLKEVIVTNPMIEDGEFIEHTYGELDTDTKIFTIQNLQPNESRELIYRAVTRKMSENNSSKTNITISSTNMAESTIQTITNIIKDAEIKITNKLAYNEEVEIHTDSIMPVSTTIKNLTDKDIINKKVRIYLSEGLEWNKDLSEIKAYSLYYDEEVQADIYEEIDNLINNIRYNSNENYVELNITNLKAGKQVLLQSSIYTKDMPIDKLESAEGVYIKIDDNVSNKVEVKVLQGKTQVSVKQTLNISENQKVKDGDNVIITAEVRNTGNISSVISIEDYLPSGLEIQKVTLVQKGQNEDQTGTCQNGIISIMTEIEKGETIKVIIETKVSAIKIPSKQIQNTVTVTLNGGEKIQSNVANIQIESEYIDEGQGNPEGTYNISGTAWIDRNKNGVKDNNEGISNITVKVIDLNNQNSFVKDSEGKEIEVKTNNEGQYKISGLSEGNYNIIFKYDTNIYELSGASNVKDYIISNAESEEKVAITNSINLKENRTDIDLQLVELKKFDLQLDKYITKVIVKTSQETRTTKYEDQKLVREEIPSKQIAGSTVLVEYTIRISNVGELPGYATEIIDYLPDNMRFNSELNAQWYSTSDGNLYNNSLASIVINPGESKDITLTLVKDNSEESFDITNIAKITKTTNSKEYKDINLSNNESTAEMLINPATGGIFAYILVVFNSVIIILTGIYIIKKKVIK